MQQKCTLHTSIYDFCDLFLQAFPDSWFTLHPPWFLHISYSRIHFDHISFKHTSHLCLNIHLTIFPGCWIPETPSFSFPYRPLPVEYIAQLISHILIDLIIGILQYNLLRTTWYVDAHMPLRILHSKTYRSRHTEDLEGETHPESSSFTIVFKHTNSPILQLLNCFLNNVIYSLKFHQPLQFFPNFHLTNHYKLIRFLSSLLAVNPVPLSTNE